VTVSPNLFSFPAQTYTFKLTVTNIFGGSNETQVMIGISETIRPTVRLLGSSTMEVKADQDIVIQSLATVDLNCNVTGTISYAWALISGQTLTLDSRTKYVLLEVQLEKRLLNHLHYRNTPSLFVPRYSLTAAGRYSFQVTATLSTGGSSKSINLKCNSHEDSSNFLQALLWSL
jgi:hypothetical protein